MVSDLMFAIKARDEYSAQFASAGKAAENFGARAKAAGQAASQGFQGANQNVSNLAAQFQDIGVQLAGGGSPFLVALQQGTQIGAVLGPMGAAGAVRSLGGAFLSVLSPVNLATIGLIAAGGAAFQYFSSFGADSKASAKRLLEEEELIRRVADRWAEALPALKRYQDELDRGKEKADLGGASKIVADKQWDAARNQVAAFNIEIGALVQDLQLAGAETDTIIALQNAWNELSSGVRGGRQDTEAMTRVHDALTQAVAQTGIPAIGNFERAFRNLSISIAEAQNKASSFTAEARNALAGVVKGGRVVGPAMLNDRAAMASDTAGLQDRFGGGWSMDLSSALEKQQKAFADGENAGGGRGSGSGKSETDRQVERLQDVMQALDDERAMITMNRTEQRALQAQRRANVDATSDEGMAIAALIGKIDEERKSYEAAEKASTFMRDAARDSFMDLLPAIDTGNKALDGFINKMAEAAAEAAFFGTGPFAGVFGTASGGSLLGDLFSFKGFRAEGGSVDPWGSYVVGEKGPEVLRMGGAGGHVTSNKDAFGGGSGVFNIDARTTVQASGNAEADADMRRWAVKRDAELPGRIIRVIKDAQMRRLL